MAFLYVSYFMGGHLFVHHHHLQNGIVVHSHPYSNPDHSHTSQQILSIDQLCDDTSLPSQQMPIVAAEVLLAVIVCVPVVSSMLTDAPRGIRLRAPPVL